MFDNFLFSVNVIFPLLILVFTGFFINKINLVPKEFFSYAEKLVFNVALPCSLFASVYLADVKTAFDIKFTVFCVLVILISFFSLFFIVPLFLKDNKKRGAFIQGAFRSNFAILGVPILGRLFPETGKAVASMIMPFAIPMFNIFSVIALSVFAPCEKRKPVKQIATGCVKGILKNPLIIGIALGFPFMLSSLTLPESVFSAVNYLGNLTTPLALMCLGVSIKWGSFRGNMLVSGIASVLKIIVVPAAAVFAAVLLGYEGVQLGVVFVLFGGPAAVSSFIMAKNMQSDHELAGQILLLTTVFCAVSIFVGTFILRTAGLI